MEDTDFNAELTYIAKDIRHIHITALNVRADFRLNLSLTMALKYQVIIEKLALALIATNRYSRLAPKDKNEPKKERKEIGNFTDELDDLAGIVYVKGTTQKNNKELLEEYNKLFPIHHALIVAIAKENLFKKKIQTGQTI